MWACGQDPDFGVNEVKFPLTFFLQYPPFLCLPEDSLMFTSISWVLCPPVKDFLIFWPWSTGRLVTSISVESCVGTFFSTWVSRFGVQAILTTDRGAQFTSSVWSGVCSSLGILASTTTSSHPQSNGMIERFHRSLKSALRSRLSGSDWFLHLPLVILGLRTVPKDDTGLSVSKAVCL